jgi:hypothetical protein
MSTEEDESPPELKYRVMLVESTPPPENMMGLWYRYVIGEGISRIDGIKPGSLQAVTEHAEAFAEKLNLRLGPKSYLNSSTRTRVHIQLLGSKKKQA